MQLRDLIKPLEECSEDELIERLKVIRSNRNVVRPAAEKRAKRATKKAGTAKVNKLEALLSMLSPEEIAALLASGE